MNQYKEFKDKTYKVFSDTSYHQETEDNIILLLEKIRQEKTRVRFHWGDVKTGKDWGDINGVKGRIGLSTGPVKIPLLIYSSKSTGCNSILDNCIVKITETKGGKILYQHPTYTKGIE